VPAPRERPLLRLLLEAGPLLAFFLVNARAGLFRATAAFMVAIALALAASRILDRRWPVLPLISAVFVLVFGGLTLALEDELFIKLKPTIANSFLAACLLGGLALGRPLLRPLLGSSLRLTEPGWRGLTLRFGIFFLALAALNEVVWRTLSTDAWVRFKVFGILPLTLLFSLSQAGLIRRHARPLEAEGGPAQG
jgi:intracellular septation protein